MQRHKRRRKNTGSVDLDTFSSMRTDFDLFDLLFYVHGKHLRSCRDGQLT